MGNATPEDTQKPEPNSGSAVAIDLEQPDLYLRQVRAEIKKSKTRAANWVAIILVIGVVAAVFVHVAALLLGAPPEEMDAVFDNWYHVVSPLLGVVIGALFGMTLASRRETDES